MAPKTFNKADETVIDVVAKGIQKADHTEDQELVALYLEIVEIFRGIQKRAIQATTPETEFGVEMNIELKPGTQRDKKSGKELLPEVQITITEQQRATLTRIITSLGRALFSKAKQQTLILSQKGYRIAENFDEIDRKRFHTTSPRRLEVPFNPGSYSNIHNFLTKVKELLIEAAGITSNS